jgi:hypothetical protein
MPTFLLCLCAHDVDAMTAQIDVARQSLSALPADHSPAQLSRVLASLVGSDSVTRRVRCAVLGANASELLAQLAVAAPVVSQRRVTVLAVPGMGTEHFGRAHLPALPRDVAQLVSSIETPQDASALMQRDISLYQRVLFDVHLALLDLLESCCGFVYDRVASFSAGEPTGAFVSGAVSASAAKALNAAMANVNALPIAHKIASTMVVAVRVPRSIVDSALARHGGEIGAIISADLHAVCGHTPAMERVYADLKAVDNSFVKLTQLPVAFHSVIFEQFRADSDVAFADALKTQSIGDDSQSRPRLPWHSSIRGRAVDDAEVQQLDFWFDLMRRPSRAHDVMCTLSDADVFVELNCHRLYARTWAELPRERPFAFSGPMLELDTAEPAPQSLQLAQLTAKLWCAGCDLQTHRIGSAEQPFSFHT